MSEDVPMAPDHAIPVTELSQDVIGVLETIRESQQPVVITQGGRASAVILTIEAFERAEREREMLALLARRGHDDSGDDLTPFRAEPHAPLADKPRARVIPSRFALNINPNVDVW
jgi:prevent-host-death family protein